jgi:nucleoside-diphosphate-sugar epimerase
MSTPKVLVTGSAGRIGRAVVAELRARGLPVCGFDRLPTPGLLVSA